MVYFGWKEVDGWGEFGSKLIRALGGSPHVATRYVQKLSARSFVLLCIGLPRLALVREAASMS
jgi:hypothetical protein